MPRSLGHPQSRTDLQTTITAPSDPPAHPKRARPTRQPHQPLTPTRPPDLPPSLRSGSRLAAAPPPGSATLPQDRERRVNAALDYIPRPCYPRRRRPPAGPSAMTAAAASSPRRPEEARTQHARGQGALGDECAQARPAGPGVRHPARGGQGRVGGACPRPARRLRPGRRRRGEAGDRDRGRDVERDQGRPHPGRDHGRDPALPPRPLPRHEPAEASKTPARSTPRCAT